MGYSQLISGVHTSMSMLDSDDLWGATQNYMLMRTGPWTTTNHNSSLLKVS